MVLDTNRTAQSDWHFVDYHKLGTIELKNDNLSKFLAEWNYCSLHSSCRFSEKYMDECFLIQIKKCSTLKGLLDNYEFRTHFY